MQCKRCGKSKEEHEKPIVLPDDTFTECPVCHYETKDFDELLDHIEESCRKGLEELAAEVLAHPKVCERFVPWRREGTIEGLEP